MLTTRSTPHWCNRSPTFKYYYFWTESTRWQVCIKNKSDNGKFPYLLPSKETSHLVCSADMMYAPDRTKAQRWGSKDRRPGSAYHELLVLPTFLPAAARPYSLPGTQRGATFDDLIRPPPTSQSKCLSNCLYIISSKFLSHRHPDSCHPR